MLSKLLYNDYRNEKIKLDKKTQVTKRGFGGGQPSEICGDLYKNWSVFIDLKLMRLVSPDQETSYHGCQPTGFSPEGGRASSTAPFRLRANTILLAIDRILSAVLSLYRL